MIDIHFFCIQLPHESTVSHENTIPADDFTIARQRSLNNENKYAKVQHVPHLRPETPTKVTHHHDDDDFEETSSNSSDKSTWAHHVSATTTERGEGRNQNLHELITLLNISSVLQQCKKKGGGYKLNLLELPYCWLYPCFLCVLRSFSVRWCSGLSSFSWYFSWCLFFSTRKPQIQNASFKSINSVIVVSCQNTSKIKKI